MKVSRLLGFGGIVMGPGFSGRCLTAACVGAVVSLINVPDALAQRDVQIKVTVQRVTAEDNIDPGGRAADFYSKVTIHDATERSTVMEGQNDISPNWTFRNIVTGHGNYGLSIEIWDEDLIIQDEIDVNPQNSKRRLDLTLNTRTCELTGDVSGKCDTPIITSGNERQRAKLQFTVKARIIDPESIARAMAKRAQ